MELQIDSAAVQAESGVLARGVRFSRKPEEGSVFRSETLSTRNVTESESSDCVPQKAEKHGLINVDLLFNVAT